MNPLFEDDEEIISIEVSRQISPKVNSEPSIESPISSSPSLSSSEASEYSLDEFDNDDDLFEMDSNNDEWKRILYGEDFERMDSDSDKTKDFDKSSSSVFKSLSDEFEPGGSSYRKMNLSPKKELYGKIFDPGISFLEKSFEKDAYKDKSSKSLQPFKALLTLDVFDPLHPPLMDFHDTKALSGLGEDPFSTHATFPPFGISSLSLLSSIMNLVK
ncbi:hypothetical protein Tco_1309453 [Tanacetum coccineum]